MCVCAGFVNKHLQPLLFSVIFLYKVTKKMPNAQNKSHAPIRRLESFPSSSWPTRLLANTRRLIFILFRAQPGPGADLSPPAIRSAAGTRVISHIFLHHRQTTRASSCISQRVDSVNGGARTVQEHRRNTANGPTSLLLSPGHTDLLCCGSMTNMRLTRLESQRGFRSGD